jgi:hypothetical protein
MPHLYLAEDFFGRNIEAGKKMYLEIFIHLLLMMAS